MNQALADSVAVEQTLTDSLVVDFAVNLRFLAAFDVTANRCVSGKQRTASSRSGYNTHEPQRARLTVGAAAQQLAS
jgi:hypothetical protein